MWRDLIEQGFEPKSLGIEIYHRIVCPAIIKVYLAAFKCPNSSFH